jgi:hypothetical protein
MNISDDDIKGFIEYFGEENIPNPTHYPQKLIWLMRWYKVVMARKQEDV